jgi:hypothetical protein
MLGGAALATAMLSGTLAFAFGPSEPSPVPVAPGPPTGLAALASGASLVGLSWTAPVSDGGLPVYGYDVYEGTSAGAESTLLTDTPVPGTSYTVSGLASGVTYYFDVTAVSKAGASGPSSEASATPGLPGAPTGLAASASGASQVGLSWTAPVSDGGLPVFGYDVYDGTSSGAESTLVTDTPVAGTSYTVSGLASGVTYYFDVTAVNRAGQSLPSNPAHAAGITIRVRNSQTIQFGSLASRVAGARFRLSASASSGLPVSFRSDTPRVCTVSGSTVRTSAAGRCAIRAAQAGNADYRPAADVTQSFTVGQRTGTGTRTETRTGTGTGAGRVLLLIAALAAVILAIAAAWLVVRQLRLRDWPPVPPPNIRAEPHGGPPAVVSVQDTGTDKTHSLRIEPHAGASVTTLEELRS